MSKTAEQFDLCGRRRFLDEWRRAKLGHQTPVRGNLRIENFFPYLGHVSILQRCDDGLLFRLTGSALCNLLETDPRGRLVEDLKACRSARAWTSAIDAVLTAGAPQSGETVDDYGRVHIWVRLPLSSSEEKRDAAGMDMVLCFDQVLVDDLAISNTPGDKATLGHAMDRAA